MKTLSRIFKESRTVKTITIKCHDPDDELEGLIDYIRSTGNNGHSFDIVVDPDLEDYRKTFSWDGDGADSIIDIKTKIESK